jgi:hypothetical protein
VGRPCLPGLPAGSVQDTGTALLSSVKFVAWGVGLYETRLVSIIEFMSVQ